MSKTTDRPSKLADITAKHGVEIVDKPLTTDSLVNAISGLRTERDRMSYSEFVRTTQWGSDFAELEAMYTENWIAKKAINVVAEDMTREWVTFDADEIPPEDLEKLEDEEEKFYLRETVTDALRWARLYGGCVIMPIFKGAAAGSTLMDPLDLSTIQPGDLISLNVIESRFVFPAGGTSINPASPTYLKPQFYTVAGAESTYIHGSRLIRFEGDPLPRWERQRHRYWGQSVLESGRSAIVEAFTSSGIIASLINEANIDIIGVENLAASIASGQSDQIKQRYELYSYLKSMFNISILDLKEEYNNRQINFANLDKIMEQFFIYVAGAFNMPVTKLLGVSPAGLNATGEHDLRNYYDWIKTEQSDKLRKPLTYLFDILSQNIWGANKEFKFDFVSLWQEDPNEKATREATQSTMDIGYLDAGVLTLSMVAKELKERGTYNNITDEYVAELERLEKEVDNEIGNRLLNGLETNTTEDPNTPAGAGSSKRDEDPNGERNRTE